MPTFSLFCNPVLLSTVRSNGAAGSGYCAGGIGGPAVQKAVLGGSNNFNCGCFATILQKK